MLRQLTVLLVNLDQRFKALLGSCQAILTLRRFKIDNIKISVNTIVCSIYFRAQYALNQKHEEEYLLLSPQIEFELFLLRESLRSA